MPSTEIKHLPMEQAAALLCLRLWVAGKQGLPGTSERIRRMAAQLEIGDAARFLEGYMEALNRGAVRPIEVGCLRCPVIGPDEQMLLDALGLAQERRTFEAMLVLGRVFQPGAVREALASAERLGRSLARVGRFLPAPPGAPGDPDLAGWFMTASP